MKHPRLHTPSTLAVLAARTAIRFYQLAISPYLPRTCRFVPTCSQYALDALQRYGFFKGLYLAARRILRCHPFGPFGYDGLP